jgi:hypothetical protein
LALPGYDSTKWYSIGNETNIGTIDTVYNGGLIGCVVSLAPITNQYLIWIHPGMRPPGIGTHTLSTTLNEFETDVRIRRYTFKDELIKLLGTT